MRYLIETDDQEGIIGMQISKWDKENKLRILTKGDPIDLIRQDLLKIKRAFQTLEQLGINKEILKSYLRTKTNCSMKDINEILEKQDEFFKKLGVK